MDQTTTMLLCTNNGKVTHNFGNLIDRNKGRFGIKPGSLNINLDEGANGVYENGRNTKMHVGSIIGSKLQRIINKTSTKWMEAKYIQDVRPQTTKDIEEKRIKPQIAHKDSIGNKGTNASTGATGSKKISRFPNKSIKVNSFLIQNSWIPNSYRVNKCSETVGRAQASLTPPDNSTGIAKRIGKIVSKTEEPTIKSDKIITNKSPLELQISEAQNDKIEQKKQAIEKQVIEKQASVNEFSHGCIENYGIIELLGKGSYATVFLARAVNEDNKHVAIKIIDGEKKVKNVKDEILTLK